VKRREFITLVGGAAAWPLAARAQQPTLPVIGYLDAGPPVPVIAFRKGLSETGFVEGRNVVIDYRAANSDLGRLVELAADFVRRRVAVIVADSTPGAVAAKAATATIPIVFVTGGNPVDLGLVASLNRPDGNLTGVTNLNTELAAKRLEVLHEVVPGAKTIAALVNPTNPITEIQSQNLLSAAGTLGLDVRILRARSEHDFDTAFATLVELRAGALVIAADPLFIARSGQLAMLAIRHACRRFPNFVTSSPLAAS
jgi:putative ABC transport system substrate-binding protein